MARKKTNAEKQREYRQRRDANTEQRAAYLSRKKEKYRSDIVKGTRKPISQLTDRERRQQRKEWRRNQRAARQAKARHISQLTNSPDPEDVLNASHSSSQQTRGRKRVARDRANCYKKNRELEHQLTEEWRRAERYKKRYHRVVKKMSSTKRTSTPSPRSRTRHLLRHLNSKHSATYKNVGKTLNFHFTILSGIKEKYNMTNSEFQKKAACRLFCEKLLKKYRLQAHATREFPFTMKRVINSEKERMSRINPVVDQCRSFFIRDDVSRMTSGKNNTITRRKVKKQRRLLTDYMINLHRKFVSETKVSISYSFFCRLRPFCVVEPTERDRQTCQCKVHENLQFICDKLKYMEILPTSNMEDLADAVVCNSEDKDCAYDACAKCKTKQFPISLNSQEDLSKTVEYTQWVLKKVPRKTTNDTTTPDAGEQDLINITVRDEHIKSTLEDLINMFQDSLKKFKKHLFNIRHQYRVYKSIHENLAGNKSLIHIDFSENYSCKYCHELQQLHFGGSHRQVALHTGVLYVKGATIPFCSISASRQKDPPAIWAHLKPVLELLKKDFPNVDTLHFFSDGPVTQYKQKANFYLMSSEPFREGFKAISWHYFEASHGKGAPDGVGGALKRAADNLIRQGHDIIDANMFFNTLVGNTSIKLFYIESLAIQEYTKLLQNVTLHAVKGTMKMHQVVCLNAGQLHYRDISCVCRCNESLACSCFNPVSFTFAAFEQNTVDTNLTTATVSPASDPLHTDHPALARPEQITSDDVGKYCCDRTLRTLSTL